MIQTRVEGLSDLAGMLRNLPSDISGRNGGPLAAALSKQARLVRNAARLRVPVDSGRLRNAIVVLRDRNPERRGRTEAYFVYVKPGRTRADKRGAFYAAFVEYGTVKHPARPYMRPAYSSNQREVTDGFVLDLRKAIESAVRRRARRGR